MKLICKNCNKEFTPSHTIELRYIKNPNNNYFCCKSCAAKYNAKYKKYNLTNRLRNESGQFIQQDLDKETVMYRCKNCNKEFELTLYQKKRLRKEDNPNLFCSKHCSVTYSNKNRNDSWKETKKQTNQLLYKNENYVNKEKISETIKQLYKENGNYGFSSNVYKQTMLDKYGVDNISKLPKQKEKLALKTITQATYNILHNKDNFYNYLKQIPWKERNVQYISSLLNIDITTFYKYYNLYNCDIQTNNYKSGYEIYLYHYIKNKGFNVITNTRKIISPKELDLYIPEKNLAIEFNGTYYHNNSTSIGKDNNYDKYKYNECNKKGIFLYFIYEWEWILNKDQVLAQIDNLLGLTKKIHKANCYIKEIPSKDCQQFLFNNHKQGKTYTNVRLGLYLKKNIKGLKKDTLVSVMCFSKSKRNTNYEYELIRFCSLKGYSIIEGASTLFNYFIDNYKPNSIISYSDIGSTSGKLYNILNFKLDKEVNGSYVWVSLNGNIVYKREQCMKNKLTKLLQTDIDLTKTEKQIMEENGFVQVQNLGRKRFVWKGEMNGRRT